jgi:hypothetical protein
MAFVVGGPNAGRAALGPNGAKRSSVVSAMISNATREDDAARLMFSEGCAAIG